MTANFGSKPLNHRVDGNSSAFSRRKGVCAMKYGELTWGQTEALVNKLGGVDVVLGILRGVIEVVMKAVCFITHTFTVLVDETLSVEEAVKAGNFNWSNANITSANFPKPVNGTKSEKEVSLAYFGKNMSEEAVIAEVDKAGYRPTTTWEGLGLARKPDLQREFPIILLGSVCELDGDRRVTYLYGVAGSRGLDLGYLDDGFDARCRFAVVRK